MNDTHLPKEPDAGIRFRAAFLQEPVALTRIAPT